MNREDRPGAGYALELTVTTSVEGDARSGGQVDDGSRDEDLARSCERGDATRDVDRDAGDVVVSEFDLAGVQS